MNFDAKMREKLKTMFRPELVDTFVPEFEMLATWQQEIALEMMEKLATEGLPSSTVHTFFAMEAPSLIAKLNYAVQSLGIPMSGLLAEQMVFVFELGRKAERAGVTFSTLEKDGTINAAPRVQMPESGEPS